MKLSVRYKDTTAALLSVEQAREMLLPVDAEAAARALASPLQNKSRRAASVAAAKEVAIQMESRPGLVPCHAEDVCVAREDGLCVKNDEFCI